MIWKILYFIWNSGPLSKVAIVLVKAYQVGLRPYFSTGCYFYPSCSEFALGSIRKKGIVKALPGILGRILRCHPVGKRSHQNVMIELP